MVATFSSDVVVVDHYRFPVDADDDDEEGDDNDDDHDADESNSHGNEACDDAIVVAVAVAAVTYCHSGSENCAVAACGGRDAISGVAGRVQ